MMPAGELPDKKLSMTVIVYTYCTVAFDTVLITLWSNVT